MDSYDLAIMARTIYGEARGSSREDRIAIAWVIRNRANIDLGSDKKPDWWGESVAGVCLAKWQFSCWNQGDPNLKAIATIDTEDEVFEECLAIAGGVLQGAPPDPTGGATHYHHHLLRPPHWAIDKRGTRFGAHLFYAGIEK